MNSERDDRRRFEALFTEHFRALLGYALRRAPDPADAADVAAETFLVAWRRIDAVPSGAEARPWLFGVARRVLANHLRGARRRDALAERLGHELLTLVLWEELRPGEAGAVLGIPAATARTRLRRARERLGRELAAEGLTAPSAPAARPVACHDTGEDHRG